MPIGGLDGLSRWLERDAPSTRAVAVVIGFLDGLETEPWRAPSVPVHDLSDQPFSEVRSAVFELDDGSSTTVWYRHTYDDETVELVIVFSG